MVSAFVGFRHTPFRALSKKLAGSSSLLSAQLETGRLIFGPALLGSGEPCFRCPGLGLGSRV